jgi:hypothetical protein
MLKLFQRIAFARGELVKQRIHGAAHIVGHKSISFTLPGGWSGIALCY